MARRSILSETQTAVLVKSRRRCCLCFGLNRDTRLVTGQIAHLDRNNENAAEDNLAFLCFDHHDEYDSRTSQRKGLTAGEVKQFRAELHVAVGRAFAVAVHFGEVTVPAEDPYAGQFTRVGSKEVQSAEIEITPIPDGLEGCPRYAVTGLALWGRDRKFGPNLGELDFVGSLKGNVIEHYGGAWNDEPPHTVKLTFTGDELSVEEDNWLGVYGMNVTFQGTYRRAPK